MYRSLYIAAAHLFNCFDQSTEACSAVIVCMDNFPFYPYLPLTHSTSNLLLSTYIYKTVNRFIADGKEIDGDHSEPV